MRDTDERWQHLHGRIGQMKNKANFWKNPAVQRAIAVSIKYPFFRHAREYPEQLSAIMEEFGKVGESRHFPKAARARIDGISMNKSTEQYIYQNCILMEKLGGRQSFETVLEIGGGFGGFARVFRMVHQAHNYTFLDQTEMLDLVRFFHWSEPGNCVYCNLEEKENILMEKDLLVTNYCLSETPVHYQEWVFENVFPKCKRVFIIDGDPKSDFPLRLHKALGKNHEVFVEDYPALPHQKLKVFWAKKL